MVGGWSGLTEFLLCRERERLHRTHHDLKKRGNRRAPNVCGEYTINLSGLYALAPTEAPLSALIICTRVSCEFVIAIAFPILQER